MTDLTKASEALVRDMYGIGTEEAAALGLSEVAAFRDRLDAYAEAVRRTRPMTAMLPIAIADVVTERARQDAKWGEQNHDLTVWATVLGEEFGETCHAMLHYRAASGRAENVEGDTDPATWLAKIRNEAIQTAAVAVAIVEFIDRGMQPTGGSR